MNAAELQKPLVPARRLLLRDPVLQHEFDTNGFVVVPFIDRPGLAKLASLWDEIAPRKIIGIYSNVHDSNVAVNRLVDETITGIFQEPAARVFADWHLAGASFLVKGVGPDSASTPHQDWNNVDETVAQSASLWVPLVDVDDRNGALHVISGSHHLRASLRSLDTPSLYIDFTPQLQPFLSIVSVPAGAAVLYAHDLFHGSKPNRSDGVRVAAVSGVLPSGVASIHYRRTPGVSVDIFDELTVTRDFYFEGIPDLKAGRLPASARVTKQVIGPAPMTLADVLSTGTPRPDAGSDHRRSRRATW